ncbi:hypothetical protein V5O48_017231 [Marasmius crinis-equi]|uniref:ATP phosphoribosyltransferase n=1 Tax=Marasmius crinis-equi TaxID=585013 RepID=A0ABR3EPI7_9AGAR
MSIQRFKSVFTTPSSSTRAVLDHLFAKCPKELGKIRNYEHCAFVSRGTGQFRPSAEANPTIGAPGTLEFVEEDRVVMVVNDNGGKEELRTNLSSDYSRRFGILFAKAHFS